MPQTTSKRAGLPDFADPSLAVSAIRGPVRPDLQRDEVLADIFTASARKWPERLALVCDGKTWTYRQLDEESTARARGLVRSGLGPGDLVGLWMPRGAQVLITQIAIAKSGAAWLPFDSEAPTDRIAICLKDANAKLLLTARCHVARLPELNCPVKSPADLVDANDQTVINPHLRGLKPDDKAYVIYTSGSTGVPKGIAITQRNICHYLRAAQSVFGVRSDDVVFQGASIAFDLSMEEIWVPYLTGASLWVAAAEVLGETDKLIAALRSARISVMDTVPTLLQMLDGDLPDLRIIILGGEACPPALIEKWSKGGRRIFNSYGPTETTVVATIAEVFAGEPVTIGQPIANHTCYIADESGALAARGKEGELLIGGPGVAPGYLGRPELTAQKFIANPFASNGSDPVLYRSGDAASIDLDGNIHFHGRIDDQVKIRGFRVELGEIETAIAEQPGVAQAAVVMRKQGDIDQLVAFVKPASGNAIDGAVRENIRAALRERLPGYMIPQRFEAIDALPLLSSGKLDRKTLRNQPLTEQVSAAQEAPRTATEATLLSCAQQVFPGQNLPLDADFFTELGGHSLLAARFVSLVRTNEGLGHITLKDMYARRSRRSLSETLDAGAQTASAAEQNAAFEPAPWHRRFLCGLAQAAVMPFILALSTGQWLSVYISYSYLTPDDASFLMDAAAIVAVFSAVQLFNILLVVAVKWLVIGRTKPGRYPMWGSYYFRLWFVQRISAIAHESWLQGTVFMRIYLRMMGAKVGRDAVIGLAKFEVHDLVDIGEDVSIGSKTVLASSRVVGNELIIGRISIGDKVVIGSSCVLENDTVISEGAELSDVTAIGEGGSVGAWETWAGSPGCKTGMVDRADLPAPASASFSRRSLQNLAYLVALIVIPPLSIVPVIPAFNLVDQIDTQIAPYMGGINYLWYMPLLAWPAAMLAVALTVGFIVCMRWILLPQRVTPETVSIHSWFYVRKWVLTLAIDAVLGVLGSLYATIYMRGWYRLMGMKIGKDSEISTSFPGRYDLVEIGEKCFIADDCIVGDDDIRHGWMTMGSIKTGNQVFVGNSAVVPPNTTLPTGSLIGVLSRAPAGDIVQAGETWYGSPAIKLPVRQQFDAKGDRWTFEPSKLVRLRRAVVEALNATFPTMLLITMGTAAMEFLAPWMADLDEHIWPVLVAFLVISVIMSFTLAGFGIAQKWLMMGVYKPTMQPMWSWWALRTESVAVSYAALGSKSLLDHLTGTPMLPWMLRLFGVKIGKGVYMETTDITEFDCVTIGDHVAINAGSSLQTHLYEDRLMKVGRINIESGVAVGPGCLVLYDTTIGANARLAGLTTLMKGECLPAGTSWAGSPAQPV